METSYPRRTIAVENRIVGAFELGREPLSDEGADQLPNAAIPRAGGSGGRHVRVFSVGNDIFARCNCKSRVNI